MGRGRKGDDVTTTGGPDQSIADPAAADQATGYPRVVRREVEPLDGDDISVEPDVARPHPRRRLLVATVVGVVLVAAGAGIAIAATAHHRSPARAATHLRSVAPASPAAAHPQHRVPVAPRVKARLTPKAGAPAPPPVVPPATIAPAPVTTPAVATPPPPPPVPAPPAEPLSVLEWRAAPPVLTVTSGGRVSFTVTVVNPTNGTVTLPNPLSCAPVLRGPKGAQFGFSVCTEITLAMRPHQTRAQRYTIYATDSGAAGGTPLPPGRYTATIENRYTIGVDITSS